MKMGCGEWAMMLALSVLWGGSFLFVGMAVHDLPPFTIVAIRVFLAALTLLVVLSAIGKPFVWDRRLAGSFLVMGMLNNVIPFSLIVWGQTHIESGLASIFNATTPFFTVIVAHLLTGDEKLTFGKFAGLVIGFAGVVLMVGYRGVFDFGGDVLPQIAVMGAAVSYAFAGVYGRRFRRMGVAPMHTATGQLLGSSLFLVPLCLVADRPWTLAMPHGSVVLSLVALAVISTALAYILYFRVLAAAGATNILLVTFLIPPSAIFLGWLVLGEQLQPVHFIGLVTIGAGLAVMDGRLTGFLFPRHRNQA